MSIKLSHSSKTLKQPQVKELQVITLDNHKALEELINNYLQHNQEIAAIIDNNNSRITTDKVLNELSSFTLKNCLAPRSQE